MEKKVLFFDIDGTLAWMGKIPKEHIQALKDLKERGHIVFICTGRPVAYAKMLFGAWVDGFVTCNGRYCELDDRVLVDHPVDPSLLKECMDIFEKYQCPYEFDGSYHGYVKGLNKEHQKSMLGDLAESYYIEDFTAEQMKAYMFLFYFDSEELRQQLDQVLSPYALLAYHGPCADSTFYGFDKGKGIEEVLKELHVSKEDAFAFGDGTNDIPMASAVGHMIAMGNGVEELKQQATYITDTFENLGLVKALKHYHLI